ncbi:SRR1-like protein isoform X2 [Carettochelys insculpta]
MLFLDQSRRGQYRAERSPAAASADVALRPPGERTSRFTLGCLGPTDDPADVRASDAGERNEPFAGAREGRAEHVRNSSGRRRRRRRQQREPPRPRAQPSRRAPAGGEGPPTLGTAARPRDSGGPSGRHRSARPHRLPARRRFRGAPAGHLVAARDRPAPTGAGQGQPHAARMEEAGRWRTAGSSRRGRARGPHTGDEPGRSGAVQRRLREAGEELLGSHFWACSQITIQESLSKCFERGENTPGSVSEVLCSFENLQLEPFPESVMKSSLHSGEPACKTSCLQCVCYGIGNFSSCVISRYQLAFLLLLLEKLQIPKSQCYIFDPLFSQLEIGVLNDLGITVVLQNEEGKHHIHEFTIFYMIHCGKALYNNLLWSNWSVDALSKMIIIGNSFKGIEERL